MPIDRLVIPSELSGSQGRNRGGGHQQIAADDDRSAVLSWLATHRDSPATLANYRKEAERLLLWCVLQRGRALSDLTHEDLLLYAQFLKDPQPASFWVMGAGAKAARHSPAWRPFAGPLGPSSHRQALSILNSLFSWLVEAGYLAGNPLALSRRTRTTSAAAAVDRYLPQAHWQEIRACIEAMPTSTPWLAQRAARVRWLFTVLYLCGLRISELRQTSMGAFFVRRGQDGRERWWLEVVGKGDKARLVPVSQEMLAELARYRETYGLPALPSRLETRPLLLPLAGDDKVLTRSAIHELVKNVFRTAARRLRERGSEHEAAAQHIERASAHWLRHTAASEQSNAIDLKIVRDNLGHANISTTSVYVHAEQDERHDATTRAHRVSWTS